MKTSRRRLFAIIVIVATVFGVGLALTLTLDTTPSHRNPSPSANGKLQIRAGDVTVCVPLKRGHLGSLFALRVTNNGSKPAVLARASLAKADGVRFANAYLFPPGSAFVSDSYPPDGMSPGVWQRRVLLGSPAAVVAPGQTSQVALAIVLSNKERNGEADDFSIFYSSAGKQHVDTADRVRLQIRARGDC